MALADFKVGGTAFRGEAMAIDNRTKTAKRAQNRLYAAKDAAV